MEELPALSGNIYKTVLSMIAIVDLEMGNVGSIRNMFRRLGVESFVTSKAYEIAESDKLVLPGVGSFDWAMNMVEELNLMDILNERALKSKVPVLGICLGMQMLTKNSEEGILPGLGWIDAKTVRFRFGVGQKNLKIPQMGWNTVETIKDSPLLKNGGKGLRFYFVHSYHVVCNNKDDIIATTTYGYDFVSVFRKDNIMGVQFHPEKSHTFGMRVLKNFAEF